MLVDQILALASLPVRPRRAMSALLDGGGVLNGLLLAVLASTVLWYGVLSGLATAGVSPGPVVVSPAAETEGGVEAPEPPLARPGWLLGLVVSGFGPIATVAGIVFLYVPASLLLVTLFDRLGSFGVALSRDFAGLLVCTLSAFAGAVYLSTGAFDHARSVLERFVESRPYDAEGLCRLGNACVALGEKAKARNIFERCVEAARTAPDHRQREVRPWQREAEKGLRGL